MPEILNQVVSSFVARIRDKSLSRARVCFT